MMQQIKDTLFSLHGLVASLIHALIVVGIFGAWIFLQVEVLGNDVVLGQTTAGNTAKGKR